MKNIKNMGATFFGLFMLVGIFVFNANNANALVCFLPDDEDCADVNTKGFWPCVGDDCNDSCDSSYNSNQPINKCGKKCKQCTIEGDPYYGKYKCPECSCGSLYNSTSSKNKCGDDCEQCTIEGDPNYGKYKCPAENCDCECTIDEDKTNEEECYFCNQCTNSANCTEDGKKKYKCSVDQKCLCEKQGYDDWNQEYGCCKICSEIEYPYASDQTGNNGMTCTPCSDHPCDGKKRWKCIDNSQKDFCIEFAYNCSGKSCSDDVINRIQMTAKLLGDISIAQTSKIDYKRYCWNFSSMKEYINENQEREVSFEAYSIEANNSPNLTFKNGKNVWEPNGLEVSWDAKEAYNVFYNSDSDFGSEYKNQFILEAQPNTSAYDTNELYAQNYFTVLDPNSSYTHKIDVDVVEKCQLDPEYYYVNPNIIYDIDKFHFDTDEATYYNYSAEVMFVSIYGIENKNDLHNHINDWNEYLKTVEFERHCKNNENCDGYYKCSPCFDPEGMRSKYTFAECEQLGKVPGSEYTFGIGDDVLCYYECKKPCTGDYTGSITENDKNCWTISTCQDNYWYEDSKGRLTLYQGETYIDRVENVKDGYVIVDDQCIHCSENNAPTRHVSVNVTCYNAVDLIQTEEKIIPGMSGYHIKQTTDDYGEGMNGNATTGYYGYVPEFCVDSVHFVKESGCAAKSVYDFIVTNIKKEGNHNLVYTFEADIPQTAVGTIHINPRVGVSQKTNHNLLYGNDTTVYPYGGGYTIARNGYLAPECYIKNGTNYDITGCSLKNEIKAGSSEINWSGELYPFTEFDIEELFCSYYTMGGFGGRYALECDESPYALEDGANDRVMMLKINSNRPIMQDLWVRVKYGYYSWEDVVHGTLHEKDNLEGGDYDFVSCKSSSLYCGEADDGNEIQKTHLCWYDENGKGTDEYGKYGKCWRDSTSIGYTSAMNHDPASTGDSSAQCMCDYTMEGSGIYKYGVFTKYSQEAYAFTELGGYDNHLHSFFPLTGLEKTNNYQFKAKIEFKKKNGEPLYGYENENENLKVTDDNWIYVLPVEFNLDASHNYMSGGWFNY